jgi:uncharacterized phage protein gp47/JayE
LAYNARSPLTAIGADLDSIAKFNSISRKTATFSTVALTLSGVGGTPVNNAVVADSNGIYWALPSLVTIGVGGSVTVTAVCQQAGAISANIGTVTQPIGGFTTGWTSVTNGSVASVGVPTESDSNLRARIFVSLGLPSSTRLAATQAAIAALPNVIRYNVLENQTGATDSYGNGPHSLTAVVQDSADSALTIATAIYNNRGIGPNTLAGASGATLVSTNVTDPNTGNVTAIGYYTPTTVPIYVTMTVHGLAGYSTAVLTAIQVAVVTYLNSLQIGQSVVYSELYGAALSARSNPDIPTFSIRSVFSGLSASPSGTVDISMLFYQVSQGISANVVVTAV